MDKAAELQNPFTVRTPEDISAEDAAFYFVDMFGGYFNVTQPGHTFLHGPRGCGKSMIFRYLEPDCQVLVRGVPISVLPFYGVYVPIRSHEVKLAEMERLRDHAGIVINEHFLTMFVCVKLFLSLSKAPFPEHLTAPAELTDFSTQRLEPLLRRAGWRGEMPAPPSNGRPKQYFKMLMEVFDSLYQEACAYLRQLSFPSQEPTYSGPLAGYLDFIIPMLRHLRELPFMPNAPFYFLLDDADNLNIAQTSILNSWVSSRTKASVSLKISTQLNYKHYRTVTRQTIDSPHDYSEIDLTSVYTSAKSGRYYEKVAEIVKRRLTGHHLAITPEAFFPPYEKQEKKIAAIAAELAEKWGTAGKGYRAGDDAYRYARPDYMRQLAGRRKSSSKYRYAGFEQLVHLSSGVVRYFLEPAYQMYGEMLARNQGNPVTCITAEVQDDCARQQALDFLISEFDKLSDAGRDDPRLLDRTTQLRNLVWALGGTFRRILLSDAAERRVFSIALSDTPSDEILQVFHLGVSYGYFHRSSIGNKEGTGRALMFVLSKRLAPAFNLDPTGFSGYKFVTSAAVKEAMTNPRAVLARVRERGADSFFDQPQMGLFGEDSNAD